MSFRNVRLAKYERPRHTSHSGDGWREGSPPQAVAESPAPLTTELADTQQLQVLLLNGKPSILATADAETLGGVDAETQCALLGTKTGVYVWRLDPTDSSPNTLFFAYNKDGSADSAAMATFVAPQQGQTEPGLVTTVNGGLVTYWESVGGAVVDGLFQQSKSDALSLNLGSNEHIVALTAVDPIGVVLATSGGRLVLVRLRDAYGKQTLQAIPMRSRQHGLLSTFTDSLFVAPWKRSIVAVHAGVYLNGGHDRLVYTINLHGGLSVWQCGINGTASVSADADLGKLIQNAVHLLYPQVTESFEIHDLVSRAEDTFYILASFRPNEFERFYLLVSFAYNASSHGAHFSVSSVHRLQSYTATSSRRPLLKLPDASSTIYAVFGDAVVLLDATTKSTAEAARWEDVVYIKRDVYVYGAGVEKGGIYVVTSAGILLVQKKPETSAIETRNTETATSSLRAKLEQAVFFARRSNPLDFDPRDAAHLSGTELSDAFESLAADLAQGKTNRLLPPMLPSLGEYLDLRLTYLKTLAKFGGQNFKLPVNTRIAVNNILQQVAAAADLWRSIDGDSHLADKVKYIVGGDLREFFISKSLEIERILVSLASDPRNIRSAIKALIAADTASQAAPLLGPNETGEDSSWMGSDEMAAMFQSLASKADELTEKGLLVGLVEVLSGANLQRKAWLKDIDGQPSKKRKGIEYKSSAVQNSLLELLTSRNWNEDAIRISERFVLLRPLATLLTDEWLEVAKSAVDVESLPETQRLYDSMGRFGYAFSSEVFRHLVYLKQVKLLMTTFATAYRHDVRKYLVSAKGKLAKVAWILDLEDGNDVEIAQTLAIAAKHESNTFADKRILASLQKLTAVATNQSDLAVAADRELILAESQESLSEQFALRGRALIHNVTDRRGITNILLHQGTKALAPDSLLDTDAVFDLLTFLRPEAGVARFNLARALRLLSATPKSRESDARRALILQQIVINTEWSSVRGTSSDSDLDKWASSSLFYQTLEASGIKESDDVLAGLLSPDSWTVPTDKTTLEKLYKWAKPETISQIRGDFSDLNESVVKLVTEFPDVEKWARAIVSKVYQSGDFSRDQMDLDN